MTGRIELKWGALTGLANLVWLYASFYFGMRDNGLPLIWVTLLVGLILSVLGYGLGLRAVFRTFPETSFVEGIRSGAVMCGVVTVLVVIAQVGYLKVIHPEYTEYLATETGRHFASEGLSENEVAEIVEGARKEYGFSNSLLQAALGAFLTGIVSTLMIVGILVRIRR